MMFAAVAIATPHWMERGGRWNRLLRVTELLMDTLTVKASVIVNLSADNRPAERTTVVGTISREKRRVARGRQRTALAWNAS